MLYLCVVASSVHFTRLKLSITVVSTALCTREVAQGQWHTCKTAWAHTWEGREGLRAAEGDGEGEGAWARARMWARVRGLRSYWLRSYLWASRTPVSTMESSSHHDLMTLHTRP